MYEESFKRQDKQFLIRNIRKEDINQDYIKLLQQLTEVNELDEKKTNELLDMLNINHNICVIEDNETKKVIGTGFEINDIGDVSCNDLSCNSLNVKLPDLL